MSDHSVRTTTNVSVAGDDALTLDMVGQFTFCPRRFHLMYVEGRWADNAYTVDGANQHRRVDALDHLLPAADAGPVGPVGPAGPRRDDGDEPPKVSRSVAAGVGGAGTDRQARFGRGRRRRGRARRDQAPAACRTRSGGPTTASACSSWPRACCSASTATGAPAAWSTTPAAGRGSRCRSTPSWRR